MTRLSFVIPVRNDARRLEGCLASIAAFEAPTNGIEILVADNGSEDDSAVIARTAGATVVDWPGLRVSALRNRGVAVSSGDLIGFVDADHLLTPGWATAALEVMTDDGVGAVGALCEPPPRGSWVQRAYGSLRGRSVGRRDVAWLGAGNMVVRRRAFDAVGGFDEALTACEDVDLCNRLRAAGWRIVSDERLHNIHVGDPSTLWSLFRAERWRGRDNLRVTFRQWPGLRELPSALAPAFTIAGAGLVAVGAASWPVAGLPLALALVGLGLSVLAAVPVLRTARAILRGHAPVAAAPGVFVVSLVYDLGRAAAIVAPAGHHRGAARAGTRRR